MTLTALLWAAAFIAASEPDVLLGDAVLPSLNQCRAVHETAGVLEISRFRSVLRQLEGPTSRFEVRDASGAPVARVERVRVQVDSGSSLSDAARLSPIRRVLSSWLTDSKLEPRRTDRRGNTFVWRGREAGGLRCVFYRPELDQIESVWFSEGVVRR